jgi:YidC/Oxa1 family membrane protein insertase
VEKRFALFLVLSALILLTHMTLQSMLAPPDQVGERAPEAAGPGADETDESAEPPAAGTQDAATEAPSGDTPKEGETTPSPPPEGPEIAAAEARPEPTAQRVALGSMAPDSPFRLLVTLNNQGASVERIELVERTRSGQFRFLELDDESGYLGYLALTDEADGAGCRINVVGPGTPAADAKASGANLEDGLRVGDVIRRLDDQEVEGALDVEDYLATTRPGQSVQLLVARAASDGQVTEGTFTAELVKRPLSLMRPEVNADSLLGLPDPLSLLCTVESIGEKSVALGSDEIRDLPSLRDRNWNVVVLEDDGTGPAVEFRFLLSEEDLKQVGIEGAVEFIKRYRLASTPPDQLDDSRSPTYHFTLDLEIHNRGSTKQQIAYRLDGPNGLPLEGWWYSNKIHPRMFASAGARDVVWSTPGGGLGLVGASEIYKKTKEAEEKSQTLSVPLFPDTKPQSMDYVGVDTQYFAVVLVPERGDDEKAVTFRKALAMSAGDVGTKKKTRIKTTNSTFRLISPPKTIAPGEGLTQRFTVFAGPKQPSLLTHYGLDRVIEYGWFRVIAKLLSSILHLFAAPAFINYGLAIILLTVLVRSCMIPLSRKATKNAQMMQQLAPEMKRIAEKYKNDMEKRAAAQKELFAKHHYNPFGGCLLMLIQLPIFIGLYRALSVDIELRQASLIPGLSWCANLAGPDMLLYWKPYLWSFLADETGWLGPYLNVLPIITIFLFLLQQKMFMPPATDDQTRMQQQMMKFMMIFMGVLFFRVPSGLCVYFIASSLWGVAERKLLPPVGTPADAQQPSLASRLAAKFGGDNGGTKRGKPRRKPQRKR